MTVSKITDVVQRGLDRLILQYKDKPKIQTFITALIQEFQELEDIGIDLFINRMLGDAVGIQLDRFGTIVDQAREGFDDDFYKILLKVKIGINISNGEPERITNILKLITFGSLVHYINFGNGNMGLSTDGTISPELINFVYENLDDVVSAGARINYIACFDSTEPFSFDGIGPTGLGFSSLAAPLEGGKFAFIHRRTVPFAFAGSDVSALGFGTLADPLAGGTFVGL
ncbi:MAG: hypothetical protein V3R67_03435 [Thermodesulfobacteriota bacterium]